MRTPAFIGSTRPKLRATALHILVRIGADAARQTVENALTDRHHKVRVCAQRLMRDSYGVETEPNAR